MKKQLNFIFIILIFFCFYGCKKTRLLLQSEYEVFEGEEFSLKLSSEIKFKDFRFSFSEKLNLNKDKFSASELGNFSIKVIYKKNEETAKVLVKAFDYGFLETENFRINDEFKPKFNAPMFAKSSLDISEENSEKLLVKLADNYFFPLREGTTKLKLKHLNKTFYKQIIISGINKNRFTFKDLSVQGETGGFSTEEDPLLFSENDFKFKGIGTKIMKGSFFFKNILFKHNATLEIIEGFFPKINTIEFERAAFNNGTLEIHFYTEGTLDPVRKIKSDVEGNAIKTFVFKNLNLSNVRFKVFWFSQDLRSELECTPFKIG